MSLPLLAAATASGLFTVYKGLQTYSIRTKGRNAVTTLLGLGDQIYNKFGDFYKSHTTSFKGQEASNIGSPFMPTFTVKGYDGMQHNIEHYTNVFSNDMFQGLIDGLINNPKSQELYTKISEGFMAIEEFTKQGAAPSFLGNGHSDIASLQSELPDVNALIGLTTPIIDMAKSSYTSAMIGAGASISSAIAYFITSNSDSKSLSGASHDDTES